MGFIVLLVSFWWVLLCGWYLIIGFYWGNVVFIVFMWTYWWVLYCYLIIMFVLLKFYMFCLLTCFMIWLFRCPNRALVAILENYQLPDGSVEVPAVLRPYMGGLSRIDCSSAESTSGSSSSRVRNLYHSKIESTALE